jgi:cytochrome b subunit of formate dehydrogenase
MNLSSLELPSNRKFGFFFSLVFLILAGYFWWTSVESLVACFIFLSGAFLLITLFKADLLLPLNRIWMRLGLVLGMIVSPVIMGIIFFGLFVPLGIMMRVFGRDELRLKTTSRPSHWRERSSEQTDGDAFKRQF